MVCQLFVGFEISKVVFTFFFFTRTIYIYFFFTINRKNIELQVKRYLAHIDSKLNG